MKITIDTKTNKFLFGQNNKMFNQLSYDKQKEVEKYIKLKNVISKTTMLGHTFEKRTNSSKK